MGEPFNQSSGYPGHVKCEVSRGLVGQDPESHQMSTSGAPDVGWAQGSSTLRHASSFHRLQTGALAIQGSATLVMSTPLTSFLLPPHSK